METFFASERLLNKGDQDGLTRWYLGIDIGTTGLSAALWDRENNKVYPIYWHGEDQVFDESEPFPLTFRLPSQVYYWNQSEAGNVALSSPLLLQDFKLFLNIGIPYFPTPEDSSMPSTLSRFGVPSIQWSQQQSIFLGGFQQGLKLLLSTLKSSLMGEKSSLPYLKLPQSYRCGVMGLEPSVFEQAMTELAGVILGCPVGASEAYRFNLKEAVCDAELVACPEQIFIVEDAIASFLYQLQINPNLSSGTILILNIGATSTEMALATLPEDLALLNRSQIVCHRFAYGGKALSQDVIHELFVKSPGSPFQMLQELSFDWPRVGYPDLAKRYRLQQEFNSLSWGMPVLKTAETLIFKLQECDRYTLNVNQFSWEISQQDLERKVLTPFIDQLNQELNHLFSQVGISSVGISQAICTGGMGSLPLLSRWLRQKLPNALIIQDSALDQESINNNHSHQSRLAWGLAVLPLYSHLFDVSRYQYNDYFLLAELLRVFQEEPLSLTEVNQRLENRGVNTRSCQSRITAILNGKLPDGLIPSVPDTVWLTTDSQQNLDYQRLLEGSLFYQDVDQNYFLSLDRAEIARQYLRQLTESSYQSWEDPLAFV